MICRVGSKSMLAKAAGAEPSGQMRDEKLHAIVARSTCRCRSQNVQNTPRPESSACPVPPEVLGFRGAKNIKIYGVFLVPNVFKNCKTLQFWRPKQQQLRQQQERLVPAGVRSPTINYLNLYIYIYIYLFIYIIYIYIYIYVVYTYI